jgi:hypothetical protein
MLAVRLSVFALVVSPGAVRGQDTLYFTAVQDARQPILNLIAAEPTRIDIGAWWFTDRVISDALVRRHRAGVRVRFLGDAYTYRDAHTRAEIDYLAAAGIPIRLRSPGDAGPIFHWKCGIFAGQNKVAFGSANWTVYSLRPYSATNYDDETMLVTANPDLVPAFKMKFDQYWVDTTAFTDFANISTGTRARLEPDAVLPRALIFGQGTEYNARLIAEIEAEQQSIDFVLYRLDAASVTDALARRMQAGVSVRLVIDPVQYRNTLYPRASANLDRLWALSVPIKRRQHLGLTHMKTIVTSTIATNGSSNVMDGWQRDHNYFIEKALRPTLHQQLKARVAAMLADTNGFADFRPLAPGTSTLMAPANGATAVPQTLALDWSDASWATNYDVMLGTTESTMIKVGSRVVGSRLLLATPLQSRTRYYWRVRARTNATPRDGTLATTTATWSFTTGSTGTPPTVSITSPAGGSVYLAPATLTLAASASDADGSVLRVEFFSGAARLCTVTAAPYTCTWPNVPAGTYTLTAVATDNAGASTRSTARTISVTTGPLTGTIVLRAAGVPSTQVHGDWSLVPSTTAAGGIRVANPDRGVPKILTASASPVSYFEATFMAESGKPYHLWLRMRAQNDVYTNDSVFVQFSGAVTSTGTATWRIGSTDAAVVSLEHTNGAGVQGWGWNDNGWAGVGPHIFFGSTGTQRIRIQVREDGVSIDQIVLSPSTYLNSPPGALKNDTTILAP